MQGKSAKKLKLRESLKQGENGFPLPFKFFIACGEDGDRLFFSGTEAQYTLYKLRFKDTFDKALRFRGFDVGERIARTQRKKHKTYPVLYRPFRAVKAPAVYIAQHKQRKTAQYYSHNRQLMPFTIHKNGGCPDTQQHHSIACSNPCRKERKGNHIVPVFLRQHLIHASFSGYSGLKERYR